MGRVLRHDNRVLRAVFEAGASQFDTVKHSGVLDDMIGKGWLLPAKTLASDGLNDLTAGAVRWLEHAVLDFVSYPNEWCFSALKAAALHHLDFPIVLLGRGFTWSDATAYNVQFRGAKPVFLRRQLVGAHPVQRDGANVDQDPIPAPARAPCDRPVSGGILARRPWLAVFRRPG